MKKLTILSALALALVLIQATSSFAGREVVRVGNIVLTDNGGISPSKLPRHGGAPVTARLIGEIETADGTHPPALQTVDVEIDKTIELDAAGLPSCRLRQIVATSTDAAKRACGGAIVGSGEAEVEVAFEDQTPFSATGPIVLFNGGVRGRTTKILLHAYVSVPAPTAIVVPATVTRIQNGRYGLRIIARVPKIAGGAGSATRFELKVGRTFTDRGQRKSLLTAACPTGKWMTRGVVGFDDGTRMGIEHAFACTPQG